MRKLLASAVLGAALALSGLARATSPFDAAVAAYDRADYDRARMLWEEALSQGDWEAARNLGTIYRRGLGVPADPGRAATYYKGAAEHGVIGAEVNLAEMYFAGAGVTRDIAEGKRLLKDAAAHGSAPAQYRLKQVEDAEKQGKPPPPIN